MIMLILSRICLGLRLDLFTNPRKKRSLAITPLPPQIGRSKIVVQKFISIKLPFPERSNYPSEILLKSKEKSISLFRNEKHSYFFFHLSGK